jgi:hypothetical protein
MKTYEITFANGETRTMVVTSADIDPRNEVARWHSEARRIAAALGEEFVPYDIGFENIVSVVEIV